METSGAARKIFPGGTKRRALGTEVGSPVLRQILVAETRQKLTTFRKNDCRDLRIVAHY